MDSATEEKHFEKLDECIKDDDKTITVPSLSRLLNIPLIYSQNILSKYVKKQREMQSNELSLTYILTGITKDNGKAVLIVKESDLAEKRSMFDKIESEMLFSVQKCRKIDFNVLSLVDDVTVANKEPLLGSIVSKNCIKRVLKIKKLPLPQPTTVKGKSSHFFSKTSPVKIEKSTIKSEDKSKGNGIMSTSDKVADKSNAVKKSLIESTKTKQKSEISAFFSKSTSNSSIKSESSFKTENSTSNEGLPHGLEELMEVDFKELDEVENKIKEDKKEIKVDNPITLDDEEDVKEEKKKESKKSEGKEKKSKNKRRRDNSEEKNLKKRKRIIQRNDSESDDMFENEEEDIIEKSDDEVERAPSPVPSKPLAPKNKIRKAVDKTYMDEEGFLVTKTEYVFESAPEDEGEVPVEKEIIVKPKLEKKTSASSEADVSPPKNAKGKKGKKNNLQNQPTLMNFFKKK